MNEQEVLHSPFNIDTHKKTFVNYLEVIILPNGEIRYAVPSHQYSVENYLADKLNISVQELRNRCPREMMGDYSEWLCNESQVVMLWTNFIIRPQIITKEQRLSLDELIKEGLYNPDSRHMRMGPLDVVRNFFW